MNIFGFKFLTPKETLNDWFNGDYASYPIDWSDLKKDNFVCCYLYRFPLDNELCDIREQIDDISILKIYESPDHFKNIVYSCLEQKLNDLVDEYNASLAQDDAIPFNHNRAMEDAGHKPSDFV